jgi:hypothetical protein
MFQEVEKFTLTKHRRKTNTLQKMGSGSESTLRALLSWKSFSTASLVDDRSALVVREALLLRDKLGVEQR